MTILLDDGYICPQLGCPKGPLCAVHEALDTRAYRIEKRPFMGDVCAQKGDHVLIFLCYNRLVASMRVLTGDETGLLKAVDVEAMRIVVLGQQTRKKAIKAMAWTGTEPGAFAVARADSVVTLDRKSVV